ncbi:beta-lactamase-like protein [Halteromyces radiatus]|uniref:beta-lactamase-like protein n=1 Tax=Halteromyces radiatus TaxID=101107 RepID=UPI002220C15D|nr:beta-lactamase-like protein [Halteromyces radiatus]KAI8092716.1 beta-lactamase-like protein [Halteromyces radiatus]
MLLLKEIGGRSSWYRYRFLHSIIKSQKNIRTMSTFLRFLGHSTPEGPATIIYQNGNDHYMFNCREGTQRLAVEDKVKLSKLKSIFFSRLQWECIGGLPGMLLTLADAGIQNLDLYGGKNLTHFMASTRNFVYRTSMTVQTHEFNKGEQDELHYVQTYKDNSLKVIPVIALPKHRQHYSGVKRRRSISPSSIPSASESSPSSMSSSSDYVPSDNSFSEEPSMESAHQHRSRILSYMFSNNKKNQHKSKKNGKDTLSPEHTIDSPCTPRKHPLSNVSSSPEAVVEFVKQDENGPSQTTITSLQQNNQNRFQSQIDQLYDRTLPRTKPYPAAISYICQGPETRGKFRVDKALELGVPKGPLFGKLQRGETVTLEDGTVVTKTQVCEPNIPGPIFMVIDCPDIRYIDDLVSSPKFTPYQSMTDTQNIPKVIIHLVNNKVLANAKYQEWMNTFSPETEHIISNQDVCAQTTLFRSHALSQYKLSKLDANIFQVPEYNNTPNCTLDKFDNLPPKVSPLMNKAVYNLIDTRKAKIKGMQLDSTQPFDVDQPNDDPKMLEFNENKDYQQAIEEAKKAAELVPLGVPFPGDDVQVITLGTGSSLPSKYRNVSATLIKIPQFGSVLLDAGEGTYGQMLRHFGRDRLPQELKDLRCIFVSHLHADHHLGIFQLLIKRKEARQNGAPLFLIAPYIYQRWMLEYNNVEHLDSPNHIRFIRCNHILSETSKSNAVVSEQSLKNVESLKKTLGLSEINSIDVVHCRLAYGLSLKHMTGWKLVYSGDTRPCDRLIEAGQNATLLIHEATLEDGMKEEAIAKRHSTTAEAVEVGEKMKARYTLLNHFSQRYAKVPTLSEAQTNVCISFDMMSVPIKQIPQLPKFTNAMQLIFKDEEEEEEDEMNLSKN